MDELERRAQDDPADGDDAEPPRAPEGDLAVPAGAVGAVVLCAWGSAGRKGALEEVARARRGAGLATLRLDSATRAGEGGGLAGRRPGMGRGADPVAAAVDRLA